MSKRVLTLVFSAVVMTSILAFERPAHAEESVSSGAEVDLQLQVQRAQGLRVAGIVTTSLGIATAVVGLSFVISGAVEDSNNDDTEMMTMGGFFNYVIGGITLGVGAAILAAGIPMWAVGAVRRSQLAAALPVPSLAINPQRSTYGTALTWRF